MFYSTSSKFLTFVSTLSLIATLQSTSLYAMKDEGETFSIEEENFTIKSIDFYYENLEKFLDYIDSLLPKESNNTLLGLKETLQKEIEQNNVKAQLLYMGMEAYGEDIKKPLDVSQVNKVLGWLSKQEDAIAFYWRALLEEGEWEGHPKNFQNAAKFYEISFEKGNIEAGWGLSSLFHHGREEFHPNLEKAVEIYLKLVEKGELFAYSNLGALYQYGGEGFSPNLEEAEKYFLKSGDDNSIAQFYHYGNKGQLVNIQKAIEYYLKLAEMGDLSAYSTLGELYRDGGEGFPPNLEEAEKYFLKCGDNDRIAQFYNYGAQFYHYGNKEEPANLERAVEYYLKLAEKGELSAYSTLGELYRDGGEGFPPNLEEAEKYFLKSGNNYKISQFYHYGNKEEPINLEKAVEYYLKLTGKDELFAYSMLGYLYQYGEKGFPPNLAKAEEYYLKAVANGNLSTYHKLGHLYQYGGNGFPPNLAKAEEYYLKAVDNGILFTYHSLGNLYKYGGNGFPQNLQKTEHYYRLGIANQQSDCKDSLTQLYGWSVWKDHNFIPEKTVHEHITNNQFAQLKTYLGFPNLQLNLELLNVIPENQELITNYDEALGWLETYFVAKITWKELEYSQKWTIGINDRSFKPEYRNYYLDLAKDLSDIIKYFSLALHEDSLAFLSLREDIKTALLTRFKIYNPQETISLEDVGLRLYKLKPENSLLALGSKNVEIGDKVAYGLEKLAQLTTHYQNTTYQLIQLKEKINNKKHTHIIYDTEFEDRLSILEFKILCKPERKIPFNEEEIKPVFSQFILSALKNMYNVPEDLALQAVENCKEKEGRLKNTDEMNEYIDTELCKYIEQKIHNRTEKIEYVQEFVNRFHQMLEYRAPKRSIKFRETYPDLSGMIE